MSSPYFTLVVEDRAHDLFVYRLLLHWGIHRTRIRLVPYPGGQGCGEQHVRLQLPLHLAALRSAHHRRWLVAITDADTLSVADRRAQLETRFDEQKIPRLPPAEAAVILIPKRSVEAWWHFLETSEADEEHRLDARFADRIATACKEAPPRLDAWLDLEGPAGPPSLLQARADLLRLRTAART